MSDVLLIILGYSGRKTTAKGVFISSGKCLMFSRSYFPFFTVANRRQSKFPCHLKRIAALDTKFDKIAFSKENPRDETKSTRATPHTKIPLCIR